MRSTTQRLFLAHSGFTLVEVLVAGLVFTVIFLLLFTFLGRAMIAFSGSDTINAAQIADSHLTQFQLTGVVPDKHEVVELNGIKYDLTIEVDEANGLVKITIDVIRHMSGESVGCFYSERFVPVTAP